MIEQNGILEISASRLAHNLALLRRAIGEKTILCATLKANAYGHGLPQIAPLLRAAGVPWAAVYSLDEALAIAPHQFDTLVLSPIVFTPEENAFPDLREIQNGRIRLNLTDEYSAVHLSLLADHLLKGPPLPIHMQIDTGLTRIGVSPEHAPALASHISRFPKLHLEGIFSHFSHGDVPGDLTVSRQLAILQDIARPLRASRPDLLVHMQNSGGALHLRNAGLNMVRIGIALYGLQPSMAAPIAGLKPIARVRAPILAIHERPDGVGVGYGHTFVTRRPSRLAVVPVGYAEGFPRGMSNQGIAQLRGADVPMVGRISMDQIVLDVSDIPAAAVGEWVTVISWDPEKDNCLDRLAQATGTIGYELATGLGGRLRRQVVE